MKQGTLPQLDACLDLSESAYRQHGTSSFTADELNWDGADTEKEHLLELAVAYGLLVFDTSAYRLACAPNTAGERWESAIDDHANQVTRAITTRFGSPDSRSDAGPERAALTYQDNEYGSVRVDKSDEFEAVVGAVSAVDLNEWTGVVLRSPGESANEVQRFADRLCDQSELADTTMAPFTKEYSDVRGTDKDELEYRVFLSAP